MLDPVLIEIKVLHELGDMSTDFSFENTLQCCLLS